MTQHGSRQSAWRRAQGFIIGLGLSVGMPVAMAVEHSAPDWMPEQIPALLQAHGVASVSLAVIVDGELVYTAAFGQATETRAATPDTVYNVASLAKPLTAELSLRLISDGQLQLDDSLSAWWIDPDLRGDARVDQLTPRRILSHQTGFPNWRDGKLQFQFDPGQGFGYSGEGFEYLAHALSGRMQQDFGSLMQERVLAPLGMTRSTHTQTDWLQASMALPFAADGKRLPAQIAKSAMASDDLYTTAADYSKLLLAILRGDGVSKPLRRERERLQVDRRAALCQGVPAQACATQAGFGLGWELFELDGHHYWMHTGADQGTFALAYLNLERRQGLVLLTNSSHGGSIVLPLFDQLAIDPVFTDWLRTLAGEQKTD